MQCSTNARQMYTHPRHRGLEILYGASGASGGPKACTRGGKRSFWAPSPALLGMFRPALHLPHKWHANDSENDPPPPQYTDPWEITHRAARISLQGRSIQGGGGVHHNNHITNAMGHDTLSQSQTHQTPLHPRMRSPTTRASTTPPPPRPPPILPRGAGKNSVTAAPLQRQPFGHQRGEPHLGSDSGQRRRGRPLWCLPQLPHARAPPPPHTHTRVQRRKQPPPPQADHM